MARARRKWIEVILLSKDMLWEKSFNIPAMLRKITAICCLSQNYWLQKEKTPAFSDSSELAAMTWYLVTEVQETRLQWKDAPSVGSVPALQLDTDQALGAKRIGVAGDICKNGEEVFRTAKRASTIALHEIHNLKSHFCNLTTKAHHCAWQNKNWPVKACGLNQQSN